MLGVVGPYNRVRGFSRPGWLGSGFTGLIWLRDHEVRSLGRGSTPSELQGPWVWAQGYGRRLACWVDLNLLM